MEELQKQEIDLLFLDINMPKFSGLSLLKSLIKKPAVIITTAYAEYAVEGFELSVTDYLLKPFSFERFFQAVLKVQSKSSENKSEKEIVSITENEQKSLFVKSDKKIIKLNFNEIYHIEAYGNYVKIYASSMILVSQTLSDFLEKLPDSFFRIHKSYVVNFNHLKLIEGNQIVLQNNIKLPIGKSHKKLVLEKIDNSMS